MKRLFLAAALAAAIGVPLVAHAQATPPDAMSADIRARMDAIRSTEKTAAFAALSADHKTKVQAIVDQVSAGKLDGRSAATQIDAILTPDESKAVVASAVKARADMRAMRDAMGGPNGGPNSGAPPNPPPPGAPGGPPPPGGRGFGGPGGPGGPGRGSDAGFVLLQLSLTREQMRAAMPRPSATP